MAERPSKFPFLGFGPIPARVTAWSACLLQPADTVEHSWLKPVPGDPGHWVVTTTKGSRKGYHHDRTSGQASLEATVTTLDLPAVAADESKQASPPASPQPPSDKTATPGSSSPPPAQRDSPASAAPGPSPATATGMSTPGASSVDAAGVAAAAIDSGYRMSPNRAHDRSLPETPPPEEQSHGGEEPAPAAAMAKQRSFSRPSSGRHATPTPQRTSSSPRRYDSKARFGRLTRALEASRDPALKPPPQPGRGGGARRSPPREERGARRVTSWESRLLTDKQQQAQRAARTKNVQSRKDRFDREHVLPIALNRASASPVPEQVPRAGAVGLLLTRAALGHF